MRFNCIAAVIVAAFCLLTTNQLSAQVSAASYSSSQAVTPATSCAPSFQGVPQQCRRGPFRRGLFRRSWRRTASPWGLNRSAPQIARCNGPNITVATNRLPETGQADCGCQVVTTPQPTGMESNDHEKTFTRSATKFCPDQLIAVHTGVFVYTTVDCSNGNKSGPIFFFSTRVLTGCKGLNGCQTSKIPIDQIDVDGRSVDRQFIRDAVAKVLAERSNPATKPGPVE